MEWAALSDQLDAYFEENIAYCRHIERLHDDNLQLRGQLAHTLQDYALLRGQQGGATARTGNSLNCHAATTASIEAMDTWNFSSYSSSTTSASDAENHRLLPPTVAQAVQPKAIAAVADATGADASIRPALPAICGQPSSCSTIAERLLEQVTDKVNDMFEQLSTKNAHVDDGERLLEAMHQLEKHNDELQRLTRTQSDRLTDTDASHAAELSAAAAKLSAADTIIEHQRTELSDLRAEHTKLQAQLAVSTASAQQQALNADAQIRRLQSHCNLLASEQQKQHQPQPPSPNGASAAAEALLTKENARLQAKLHEMTRLHANACATRDALAAEQRDRLTGELNAGTAELCSLNAENVHQLAELEELRARHVSMQTINAQLHTRLVDDCATWRTKAEQSLHTADIAKQTARELSAANAELRQRQQTCEADATAQREQVARLRERLAFVHGTDLVRTDLLQHTVTDAGTVRDELQRQHTLLADANRELAAERSGKAEMAAVLAKLQREFNDVQSQYGRLQTDYKQLKDVKEHAIVALSAAQQWKCDQRERDAEQADKFAKQAETIGKLQSECKRLNELMYKMYRDFEIQKQQRQQPDQYFSHTPLPQQGEDEYAASMPSTRLFNSRQPNANRNVRGQSEPLDQHTRRSMENIICGMRNVRLQYDEGMSNAAAAVAAAKRRGATK